MTSTAPATIDTSVGSSVGGKIDDRPQTAADSTVPRQLPANDLADNPPPALSGKQNPSVLPRTLKDYNRVHQQQWNRILQRSDEDAQLLDLMRDYFKRRLELEQQAANSLEKLNKQYRMKSIQLATQYQSNGSGQNQSQMVEDAIRPTSPGGTTQASDADINLKRRLSTVVGAREHRPSSILIASKNAPSFLLPADANMSSHSLQVADPNSDNVCITRLSHIAFHKMLMDSDLTVSARCQLTEQLSQVVVDRLKEVTKEKSAFSKKMTEWVTKVQMQAWNEYNELEKSKRAYDEAYEMMQYYKAKFETEQHAPKSGLRNLMSSKEERLDKARKKFVDAVQNLGQLRNKYMIQTAIVNSVQRQLYENVVPEWLRNIDGDFYTKYQQALFDYINLERSSASKASAALEETKQATERIHQKDEHLLFFNENKNVFNIRQDIKFVPVNDQDRMVMTLDESAKKELQTLLDSVVSEYKATIKDLSRKEQELKALYTLKNSYQRNPDFGNAEATMEARTSACFEFSKLLISKAKMEGQILLLTENGLHAPVDLLVPDPVISMPSSEQLALSKSKLNSLSVQKLDFDQFKLPEIRQTDSLASISLSPKKSSAGGAKFLESTSANQSLASPINKSFETIATQKKSVHESDKSKKSITTNDSDANRRPDTAISNYSALGDVTLGGSRFSLKISQLDLLGAEDHESKMKPETPAVKSIQLKSSTSHPEHAHPKVDNNPSKINSKDKSDSQSIGSYDSDLPGERRDSRLSGKAIALFQYTATTGSEMDLREDALIQVLQKPDECSDGWIRCKDQEGRQGLVPLTYICLNQKSDPQFGSRWQATVSYQGKTDHELSLSAGDVIMLRTKDTESAELWEGILEGRVGLFPHALVKPYQS